ncbi:hypothetical protein pb186bvf_012738 [Paramecium bursaria]
MVIFIQQITIIILINQQTSQLIIKSSRFRTYYLNKKYKDQMISKEKIKQFNVNIIVYLEQQREAQLTHGVIEICFVLDCTKSMDPHIKNAINCIELSIQQIKEQTQRDCRWAAVAYKDVDYLQATKYQFYPQMDFVSEHEKVMEFIRAQKCSGGADLAEDLQQAFKQAANLCWQNYYRLIMLVTDAPCHGKNYHNNVSDDYPERTIEEELDLLMNQKIFLICIILPPQNKGQVYTENMFKYFRYYYDQKGFRDKITVIDCQNMKLQDLQLTFTQSLKEASLTITNVQVPQTQLKRQGQQIKGEIFGAAEALYKKLPDPTNFDSFNGITVRSCKFTVYRCEFKPTVFQSNAQQIWNIGHTQTDYDTQKQNQWDCIRTETHFAEGQMKKVYLMKKMDRPLEVYVIKSPISGLPYKSLQEACKECRSHLVAKILMKKFKDLSIDQKKEKNIQIEIPPISYSDFLILEEEGKPSFWIAERFFKGEFVKYNNNNGYIRNSIDSFNQFSQAFTAYTYFQSEGTMMICDVQGIGQYFTDPAINTKKGGFDQTDIGEDGIKNYLVNFKGKGVGKEYLKLLGIDFNS